MRIELAAASCVLLLAFDAAAFAQEPRPGARSGTISGPRRPQHRLGRDERAHLRARGLSPIRPARSRSSSARRAAGCGSRPTAGRPSSPCSTSSRCSRSAPSRSIRRIRRTSGSGTGEAWTRNSVSIGDGIYKSTDGGETWTNVGPAGLRAHLQDHRRPAQRRHRLCVRAGQAVERLRPSAASTRRRTAASTWPLVLKGSNLSTGCGSVALDPHESRRAARGPVGLSPQGLDVPLRRRRARCAVGQRPVSQRGRRQDLDGAHRRRPTRACRRSPRAASRSPLRPSDAEDGLCVHRVDRLGAVHLARRRRDLGARRQEPVDGVAAVLLREPHRRSDATPTASSRPTAP